jgi:hypothetical protein
MAAAFSVEALTVQGDKVPEAQAYKEAVQRFVSSAFDEPPPQIERETAELMLSNPFDLTLAAELMARGHTPSPTALVDEAFRLAAERYQMINLVAFPLGPSRRFCAWHGSLAEHANLGAEMDG